jgi:hypothetical protein
MSDVAQPVESAPVASQPMDKPDISHTLTAEKEATGIKQAARLKRLRENAITADEKGIRSITRKREDNSPAVVDFSEDADPKTGTLKLRDAQKSYARMHNEEYGRALNQDYLGHDPKKLTDDYAREIGEYVSERGRKASESGPKDRLGLIDNRGQPLVPRDDEASPNQRSIKQHLKEQGEGSLSVKQSAEYLKNFRDQADAYRAQTAAEIKAQIQQQDAAASLSDPRVTAEIDRAAAQHNAEQQRQQQAEQQRQAQARQAQQQQATQWQHAQAELARMSVDEMRCARDWELHRQQMAAIPEFADKSGRLLQETYAKDPQRFQQLQKVAQTDQQWAGYAARIREAREVREHQIGQVRQAQHRQQIAAFAEAEDSKFREFVASEMPEYSTAEGKRRLAAAAKEVLRSTGLTDQQIAEQWQSGYLRPFGFQKVIAEAARWRLARESMRNVQRQQLPPAQKPGMATPRGAASAESVAYWEKQLANARTTREQVMAAGKLQKAKREARA